MDVEGFEARVIQHEIDHLDGILIFDRAEDLERREALRELRLRAG
jgi:peptide deformylase